MKNKIGFIIVSLIAIPYAYSMRHGQSHGGYAGNYWSRYDQQHKPRLPHTTHSSREAVVVQKARDAQDQKTHASARGHSEVLSHFHSTDIPKAKIFALPLTHVKVDPFTPIIIPNPKASSPTDLSREALTAHEEPILTTAFPAPDEPAKALLPDERAIVYGPVFDEKAAAQATAVVLDEQADAAVTDISALVTHLSLDPEEDTPVKITITVDEKDGEGEDGEEGDEGAGNEAKEAEERIEETPEETSGTLSLVANAGPDILTLEGLESGDDDDEAEQPKGAASEIKKPAEVSGAESVGQTSGDGKDGEALEAAVDVLAQAVTEALTLEEEKNEEEGKEVKTASKPLLQIFIENCNWEALFKKHKEAELIEIFQALDVKQIDQPDQKTGLYPLHYAAYFGFVLLVNVLINELKTNINALNIQSGMNALHYTMFVNGDSIEVNRNCAIITDLLIKGGINVDCKTLIKRATPLYYAALKNRCLAIPLLLDGKADMHVQVIEISGKGKQHPTTPFKISQKRLNRKTMLPLFAEFAGQVKKKA